MSKQFTTEQEAFWAGKFGDDYIARNTGEQVIGHNTALFSRVLAHCTGARSLIEFGANIGLNLRSVHALQPDMTLDAIEINEKAADELQAWGGVRQVFRESILDFKSPRTWDIALVKGVLIHINPEYLERVYDALFHATARYLIVAEYYSPNPVEIPYRGHAARLFKRDFAGELLDRFAQLRIVDYGFVWHRDPMFPQDDITWFVLQKGR